MGYSHRWQQRRPFTDAEWKTLLGETKRIIAKAARGDYYTGQEDFASQTGLLVDAAAFGGQRMEVVEGEGSSYGAHDLRPFTPPSFASTPGKTKPTTSKPPVRLQRMPDGSFRLAGLGRGGRVHLRRDMRAWRREDCPDTGETFYVSWGRQEAETYAQAHGLTIETSHQS